MGKKYILWILVLLIILLLVLSGCGNKKSKEKKQGRTEGIEKSVSEEPPAVEAQPKGTEFKTSTSSSSEEIPEEFQVMMDARPKRIFYIAINDPKASNSNDGLSIDKPFKDLSALERIQAKPGDAIALRAGTYNIAEEGIKIKFVGELTQPIKVFAYEEERVILDHGTTYEELKKMAAEGIKPGPKNGHYDPLSSIKGKYLIIEGLTFTGCLENCMLYAGSHNIIKDNTLIGGGEEDIKTITGSSDVLFLNNDFSRFMNEAIDIFGAHRVYVIGNKFHDNDASLRVTSPAIWAKAGAKDVSYINNEFYNLDVNVHAMVLGGCCWNNWDSKNSDGSLKYMAENVRAIGNTFRNINLLSDYKFRGTIAAEGCDGCLIKDNILDDVDVAFSLRATENGPYRLAPRNVEITGNILKNIRTGRILNIENDATVGFKMSNNKVYVEEGEETINLGDDILTLREFQNQKFDVGSSILPP